MGVAKTSSAIGSGRKGPDRNLSPWLSDAATSLGISLVRGWRVWEGGGVERVLNSSCDINEAWRQVTTFLGLTLFLSCLQPGSQYQASSSPASRGGQVSVCALWFYQLPWTTGWHRGGEYILWGWNWPAPEAVGLSLAPFQTPACLRS